MDRLEAMKTIADLEAELRGFDKIGDEARVVREIRPPPLTKKRWKYTAGSLCRAASASKVSRYNDFDEISPSHCLTLNATPRGNYSRDL